MLSWRCPCLTGGTCLRGRRGASAQAALEGGVKYAWQLTRRLDWEQWLGEVSARVRDRLSAVEILHLEPETLTLDCGLQCVILYGNGAQAMLSPSVSFGGAIASRPEDRVQHLEIHSMGSTTPRSMSRRKQPLLTCTVLCRCSRRTLRRGIRRDGTLITSSGRAQHSLTVRGAAARPCSGRSPRRSPVTGLPQTRRPEFSKRAWSRFQASKRR